MNEIKQQILLINGTPAEVIAWEFLSMPELSEACGQLILDTLIITVKDPGSISYLLGVDRYLKGQTETFTAETERGDMLKCVIPPKKLEIGEERSKIYFSVVELRLIPEMKI